MMTRASFRRPLERAASVSIALTVLIGLPACGDGSGTVESGELPDGGARSPAAPMDSPGGRGGSPAAEPPTPSEDAPLDDDDDADGEPGSAGSSSTTGAGGRDGGSATGAAGGAAGPSDGGAAGSAGTPQGDAGSSVSPDGCLGPNIDVPVAALRGTITPPQSELALRNGDDLVPVVSDAMGAYYVRAVPGTYEVVTEDPIAGSVVVESALVLPPGGAVTRDFELPELVLLNGTVSVNGQTTTGLGLSLENEQGSFYYFAMNGEFGFQVTPGVYDLFLTQQFSDLLGPDNQHAKLATVTVAATGAVVALDVAAATLSGTISGDGIAALAEPTQSDILATAELVGADGDRVALGYLPKPDYSIEVVPGTYDLYVEGSLLQSGIAIASDTALDIDVPTGTVAGALPEGFEDPVYTYYHLRNTTTGRELELSSETSTHVVPAGIYDLVYRGPLVSGVAENPEIGWPRTQSVVLRTGVVVAAAATTDLDFAVPSALLEGRITLGGEDYADADANPDLASFGWLFLRGETSDVDISLDTVDGTYAIPLVPGSYDLYYAFADDQFVNTPLNDVVKLESGIMLSPSGTTHDIDIPIALWTGKFTIGGKERSELDGFAQFHLVTEEGSLTLPVRGDGTLSVPVVARSYDLYYDFLTGGTEAPINSFAKIATGLELPAGPVELDVDVPSANVAGSLTVGGNGVEPSGSDGLITLIDENGDATTLGLLSLVDYDVNLIPGRYEVFYTGVGGGEIAPANTNTRLGCLVAD